MITPGLRLGALVFCLFACLIGGCRSCSDPYPQPTAGKDNVAPAHVGDVLTGVAYLHASGDTNVAVLGDGQLAFWGWISMMDGAKSLTRHAPALVATAQPIDAVHVGTDMLCSRTKGDWWCFGNNAAANIRGQEAVDAVTPAKVAAPEPLALLATDELFACGVADGGRLHCWWRDPAVDPTVHDAKGPVLNKAIQLITSLNQACARSQDGSVRCFSSRAAPLRFATDLPAALDIAGADGRVCAATGPKGVWCWRWGEGDELDVDRASERHAARVAVGSAHACALDSAGDVWCWGDNADGAVGPDLPERVTTPSRVGIAGQASHISAGKVHSCARLVDGRVQCWGGGSCGHGTPEPCRQPVFVTQVGGAKVPH